MSIADDRKRYEQAREQGRQAFRGGRKPEACPYRAGTSRDQREAWHMGYEEARAERRRSK